MRLEQYKTLLVDMGADMCQQEIVLTEAKITALEDAHTE
jgi:hypothetical protein